MVFHHHRGPNCLRVWPTDVAYVNMGGHIDWPPGVCHHAWVTDLEEAARRYREARDALDEARPILAAAIVDAARGGTRQAEIVRVTGYTREQVRRICRAAGVEPGE